MTVGTSEGGRERLAHRTAWGMLWATLGTATTRLVALAATMVLARLLGPVDFGLLAFALVVIAYGETVGDLGASMALIYWPDRRDDAAQVTFAVNLLMGAVWFVMLWTWAPALASFLGRPEGEPVLRAIAFAFPIKALGHTHEALARKDLGFRALLLPELAMALCRGALAVVLALMGFGVWSLVVAYLAGLCLWTALLWVVVDWRPGLRWPEGLLGPMLGYGRGLVAVNVLAAVVHHIDFVIVGRMLGLAALGFYQIAYRLPEMSVTMLMRTSSRVLFPAFSLAHAGDRSLREPWLAALRYVAVLALPASAGLFLLAGPMVTVLFGEDWAPSIPVLRALALYVLFRALGTHGGDVLKASGRSGLLALLGVAKAAVLVPALLLAARESIAVVGAVLAGVTFFTMILNQAVACRITGASAIDVLRALRPGMIATGAMSAVLLLWGRVSGSPSSAWWLALTVGLGAVVYAAALRVSAPETFHLAVRSLARRRDMAAEAP